MYGNQELERERVNMPHLRDYVALWALKLAKMHRPALGSIDQSDCQAFYEKFFEEKDIEAYAEDPRMRQRRNTIVECLDKYAPHEGHFLDVGCGLGDVLSGIPSRFTLNGFDYSDFNVNVTKKRLGSRARILKGSIYEIPFESCSMDVCTCLEVLEHIEDDDRAMQEISRVLKPGGFLIVAVPYTFYWPQYKQLMGHLRHYTRQSLRRLASDNGLVPELDLPNYPNWHQAFTRRYQLIRAQAMTIGRLLGSTSVYTYKWPWRSQPAIKLMERRLESLRKRDEQLDYSAKITSTFLLARKPSLSMPR